MTSSLVVGLVLGLQPPIALFRDASLSRRAVLGAASAAVSPLLVGGIALPASAKEPEPSAADLYREVAADTAGLRKDIVTLRTSSSSLLGELKKNLESTQGAASRLVALGGDLNASATLLGGALAEGDAVAGRLSAVESTLLATASAGFQEADSLSGSTSTAALAARSYAKAEGLATQYSEAKDELKAFRAVVATAKPLPKKLEVALKEEAKAAGAAADAAGLLAAAIVGLTDAAAFVAEPGKDGEGGPPPGGRLLPDAAAKQAAVPVGLLKKADAELRDSAGALLKAFDALTDCADVVDSATAALKGSKGLKAPAASAFAETDKTILGAQKTLTSLATSLAAASDTTATLLAKQDALAASYAAAAKVDATATALLKKAQSKGKAQAGALLKGR